MRAGCIVVYSCNERETTAPHLLQVTPVRTVLPISVSVFLCFVSIFNILLILYYPSLCFVFHLLTECYLKLDIFLFALLYWSSYWLYLYCSQVLPDHCWLFLRKFLALFNCPSTVDPLLTLFSNCFTIALCNTPLLPHQLHAIPLQYSLYRYRYNYTHTYNWLLPHNW